MDKDLKTLERRSMDNKMEDKFLKEKDVIEKLLKGTYFVEFTFHTGFELKFVRKQPADFCGKSLPTQVKISILNDWWFGIKKEWDNKVEELTKGMSLIEPDEPVLSYELTCLRWTEDSYVEKVDFCSDSIGILFKCGKSIFISYYNEMDYSWVISGCDTNDLSDAWTIICEDAELFVSTPK